MIHKAPFWYFSYSWSLPKENKTIGFLAVEIIVDNFLIHGADQTAADQKLRRVLDRNRKVGLMFNPKNWNFGFLSLTINHLYLFLCLQHSHLHTPSLPTLPTIFSVDLRTLSLGILYYTCNATKVAR